MAFDPKDNLITWVNTRNKAEGFSPSPDGKSLAYGQSITDGCIDWETTVSALSILADAVTARRKVRSREFRERSA